MNCGRLPGCALVISMPASCASAKCRSVERPPSSAACARRRSRSGVGDVHDRHAGLGKDRGRPGSRPPRDSSSAPTTALPSRSPHTATLSAVARDPCSAGGFRGIADTPGDRPFLPQARRRLVAGVSRPGRGTARSASIRPGQPCAGARQDGRMTSPPFRFPSTPRRSATSSSSRPTTASSPCIRCATGSRRARAAARGVLGRASPSRGRRRGAADAAGSSTSTSRASGATFDLPLDWRLVRGFTRAALEAVARIPYGETAGLRRGRDRGGQSAGGARRGHGVRDDAVLDRRAGAPRGARRRLARRVRRASRGQASSSSTSSACREASRPLARVRPGAIAAAGPRVGRSRSAGPGGRAPGRTSCRASGASPSPRRSR